MQSLKLSDNDIILITTGWRKQEVIYLDKTAHYVGTIVVRIDAISKNSETLQFLITSIKKLNNTHLSNKTSTDTT